METVSNKEIWFSHAILIALHLVTFGLLFGFGLKARKWLSNKQSRKVDNFILLTIVLSGVWAVITLASIGAFVGKDYTVTYKT
jgi:hypothetical protein